MSGPYHVHEGKAFQSEGLFDRAKAYAKGTNTKGSFPIEAFLTGGTMGFKQGTKFDNVTEVTGLYKVEDKENVTSDFYEIKITNKGSQKMYSDQYNSMDIFLNGKINPIGPRNTLGVYKKMGPRNELGV